MQNNMIFEKNIKAIVSIAGFDPLDDKFRVEGDKKNAIIRCKSLHCHGKNDLLVPLKRTERLRDMYYAAACVENFEHEGGHGVPTSKEFREKFESFLLDIVDTDE